jgi:hypothetical protein
VGVVVVVAPPAPVDAPSAATKGVPHAPPAIAASAAALRAHRSIARR